MMKKTLLIVSALSGVAALSASALADLSGNALTVTAQVGEQSGSFIITEEQLVRNGDLLSFSLSEPVQIRTDSGDLLASIDGLTIGYIGDPVISIGFAISAGNNAVVLSITSAVLGFAPFNAEARASASLTLTDNDGNGAVAGGLYGVNEVYRANYNGAIPAPTVFDDLVSGFGVGAFTSSSLSDASAAAGVFLPIGVTNSQQASYSFSLTANDSASGTSVYVTREIPAPGALALLGLGGLVIARRRR